MGENNRFCSLRKRKDLDKIAQSNSVRLCISSFLCGPEVIYGHIVGCIVTCLLSLIHAIKPIKWSQIVSGTTEGRRNT